MGIEIQNGRVTFTYQAPANTQRVALAGTFNHWNHHGYDLTPQNDTTWAITLPLHQGRHLYKYVLNDTQWTCDPENPDLSEDGQNNSSFTLIDGLISYRHTADAAHPSPIWQRHTTRPSASWVKEAVIYALNVPQFSRTGFSGLIDKLPYLKELGVNTLWLMPFLEVGLKQRVGQYGDIYAVKSFYTLNKAYGTKEDLRQFIAAAHREGFKVIMDWTLNRMSADADIATKHPEWFTQNEQGELYYAIPNRSSFIGFNFENRALRKYIITALKYWVNEFKFNGFRFDDSDLTPLDFLNEIRQAFQETQPELLLISQAYDELHHLAFCDLTYEGELRSIFINIIHHHQNATDLARAYDHMRYSFPKHALRMRWLEEKEQPRLNHFVTYPSLFALTSLHLTLDGVPFILMGQEFNDKAWQNYLSLSEPFELNWSQFDVPLFNHFQRLIKLRSEITALCYGEVIFIPQESPQMVAFCRQFHHDQFVVVVNLSQTPQPLSLPPSFSDFQVIFSDDELDRFQLAPYKTVIGKIRNLT